MRSLLAPLTAAALLALGALGCSSVHSSAVRTDGMSAQRNVGAIRLYGVQQPGNTRVVGMVEVHAVNEEANIETLMPVFMQRVAELGGSGGVVDHVDTGYEWRTEMHMETYAYPCGRTTCYSSHLVPYTYEVRFLTISGRALLPADAAGPPSAPPATTAPPSTAPPPPTMPPPIAPPKSASATTGVDVTEEASR